jgi:GH24 family phage-related lysozyme (muramidase)
MKPSVRAAFPAFTEKFEGHTNFLYCDVKGLVTTGRGNLVDPIGCALGLPWQLNGAPASQADIIAGWHAVKDRTDLALHGGFAYRNVSQLRLTEQAIDDLTLSKLDEMEFHLKSRLPNWDDLPADAQLGVLSVAWACGPYFHFPAFIAALLAKDFIICSVECRMNVDGNPGLIPRNAANKQLFLAAAATTTPDQISPLFDIPSPHFPEGPA